MKESQSVNVPSIKYVIYFITIILFIFCCIRSKVSLKSDNLLTEKSSIVSSFIDKDNTTMFSSNKVETVEVNTEYLVEDEQSAEEQSIPVQEEVPAIDKIIVFDGMTEDELTEKLNRSLTSTLSGTGYIFSSYTARTGLDPYLAISIVLHETGCRWGCSDLVNTCYNVGGVKGAPGCYGGEYQAYSSLNEGITYFLDNLYYNYYARGLTTPELINPYYAESTSWASQVNNYINQVRYT